MTRNRIIALLLLLGVLAGGWWFGSPWWTLYQMREAAEARDADKLAGYIDFPSLRQTSKAQLQAAMLAEANSNSASPDRFGAAGSMMAMAMIGPLIDALMTPEMMRQAFEKAPAGGGKSRPALGIDANGTSVVRSGLDEFRLHRAEARGEEGDLIFRRHGLGWKLAEVRLPKKLSGR